MKTLGKYTANLSMTNRREKIKEQIEQNRTKDNKHIQQEIQIPDNNSGDEEIDQLADILSNLTLNRQNAIHEKEDEK
jgi:hypothetical protein